MTPEPEPPDVPTAGSVPDAAAATGSGTADPLETLDTDGDLAAAAAVEPVEVVDEDGRVLGLVGRAEMRAGRLRHRCTYVLVVDGAGRLVVHQRAAWKDVWPSRWDLAFGGVCGPGEAWADAAARELAEEAGVVADLEPAGGGPYEDDDVALVGRVFVARHDGPFTFPDGEVATVERVDPAALGELLRTRAWCPDGLVLAAPALRALGWSG